MEKLQDHQVWCQKWYRQQENDLVNKILVEAIFPAERELSTVVNCCKRSKHALERGTYRELK